MSLLADKAKRRKLVDETYSVMLELMLWCYEEELTDTPYYKLWVEAEKAYEKHRFDVYYSKMCKGHDLFENAGHSL
jgi:hypothetical protein